MENMRKKYKIMKEKKKVTSIQGGRGISTILLTVVGDG